MYAIARAVAADLLVLKAANVSRILRPGAFVSVEIEYCRDLLADFKQPLDAA